MSEFWNLTFSGLVTGAIYGIMASGLVLTYTTSGIFNFAHGAVAFATAYLYYQLNTGLGVPIVPALIISVFIFAPLLGLLLDRILLRRLATAPVYAADRRHHRSARRAPRADPVARRRRRQRRARPGPQGQRGDHRGRAGPRGRAHPARHYKIGGVVLNSDQIAVFVVAAIAAIVLWFVIRRTRVGLEMRAVVDRESLANIRGVNAARTSAAAWIMTMILAGLGGVLIAPLFQLQDFVFTLVVLGSLAAVVLGGLRSIPIAFVGGLLLGVIQNLVAGYSDDVLPELLERPRRAQVVGAVLARDRAAAVRRSRSDRAARARSPTTSRHPTTARDCRSCDVGSRGRCGPSSCSRSRCGWFGWDWLRADAYDQTVIAQSLAMAIIFLSFVVVTGMSGQVSLMQASFVTAGGFAAGWALTHDFGDRHPGLVSHRPDQLLLGGGHRCARGRRARRRARVAADAAGWGELRARARWPGRSSSRWCRSRSTRSATVRAVGRSGHRRSTSPV